MNKNKDALLEEKSNNRGNNPKLLKGMHDFAVELTKYNIKRKGLKTTIDVTNEYQKQLLSASTVITENNIAMEPVTIVINGEDKPKKGQEVSNILSKLATEITIHKMEEKSLEDRDDIIDEHATNLSTMFNSMESYFTKGGIKVAIKIEEDIK